MVNFDRPNDRMKALLDGPWLIYGHYLTVQPWTPAFSTSDMSSSLVVWVRFPGMKMHMYHKKILRIIADTIGKAIHIDYNTAGSTRGKFARVAVELDL